MAYLHKLFSLYHFKILVLMFISCAAITIYRQYQNCQNIVSTILGLQRLSLRYCCHSKNGQRFTNNDWAGLSNVLLPTVIVHRITVILLLLRPIQSQQ
jgi:hypothetical protein